MSCCCVLLHIAVSCYGSEGGAVVFMVEGVVVVVMVANR